MNLQPTLALSAFPLLISRAIQVSTGIPAARACCLPTVQTEPMEKKKSLCFPPQQGNVCACAFGWQGDFFELPVLSSGSEPTQGKDTKSVGCQAALAKLLFGAAARRRSLRTRVCSSHAKKVDVD